MLVSTPDGTKLLVRPAEFDARAGLWFANGGGIQPPIDGLAASWSCQVRAHSFEQNGSPSLTAITGRSLRQFTQRPSARRGGSARSEGCSLNLNRALSANFP